MPSKARSVVIWVLLLLVIIGPLFAALQSPLLQWRDPIYIFAGVAGIIALALLLVQPLLVKGALPGLAGRHGRRVHHWVGTLILLAIFAHVGGLWLTSPPDVIDVLLFRSPTPFAVWGAAAMWANVLMACSAAMRRPLRLSPRRWRQGHGVLAAVIVSGSVVHALLIEGTMELMSKFALCALVVLAGIWGFGIRSPTRS